jgi:hypothetical protein
MMYTVERTCFVLLSPGFLRGDRATLSNPRAKGVPLSYKYIGGNLKGREP